MSSGNRELVSRWVNAYQGGQAAVLAAVADVFAADCVVHDPIGEIRGTGALRESVRSWFEAMPDLRIRIEKVLADGDHVAYRFNFQGTQKGQFMGFRASGNQVHGSINAIAWIVDGKIAEQWQSWDFHGFLLQLTRPERVAAVTRP